MASLLSAEENSAILQRLQTCGQRARQAASQPFDVFEKGHEDYVTTVDQSLDRYLFQEFTAQFPEDGIITEENQASAAEFLADHSRLWFIDPIDGTEDFIHRGSNYSVMVGLVAGGQPRAGWVHAPAYNGTYWGGAGWGLFQQQGSAAASPLEPVEPSGKQQSAMLLGDRDQRRFGAAIAQQLPHITFDTVGSFGLKVIEVIKGQVGLYVYLNSRVKLWDTTGPMALALAAGLTCCDLDGNPIRFDVNSIYPQTLIHRQPIIIGWPAWIAAYREGIRQAVLAVRSQELSLCAGE